MCEGRDRENYFGRDGQNVRQDFNDLPDILSPCQTYFPVDNWQISLVILVFLVGHFMCVEPCWTKCPAMSELSAGHQQESAGHISRSLVKGTPVTGVEITNITNLSFGYVQKNLLV